MSETDTSPEMRSEGPTGTTPHEALTDAAEPEPTDGTAPPETSTALTAANKRRRRGKRGGRNRRKPATNPAGATVSDADADDDDGDSDGEGLPDDWTDAAADRGYTDDDVLLAAKEDAGLEPPPRPFLTPAVPPPVHHAPAAGANGANGGATGAAGPDAPAKKKRRRRGGRGRNKSLAGTPGGAGTGGGIAHVEGVLDYGAEDGPSVLESLDEATLERRRGLQRKGRATGRYMMVVHTNATSGRTHVAVLEGRNLVEHYVAEPQDDERTIDGNIYLGKVQNVQPGMEAAFVDIGTQKNAILYRGDVKYDAGDHDGERPRIERVLRNGDRIVAQVTKNPIAHKGARLTQEVSLAGRFVVMVPNEPGTYGISKRLPDDERKRLRRVLDRVKPAKAGLIVRTAAEGATEEELERDLRRLNAQWEQIEALAKQVKPGTLLYKEPPLAIRVIREEFTKEHRAVVLDDRALHDEVRSYVEAVAPELADRVELYDAQSEGLPLFERYHVHEQLHKALDRKVWLPSGGSVIVEHTEALTVIDVNTGKNVGKTNLEETVYRNNLEAAEVIARELRLRDIGGIIVIDFIDMESKANREAVERAFRDALARDKTRTQVFAISELGLLEMTRKRVSEGLVEAFSETCPHCHGRGMLVDLADLDD